MSKRVPPKDNKDATGLQMFDTLIADLGSVNNPNTKELDDLDAILNDMSSPVPTSSRATTSNGVGNVNSHPAPSNYGNPNYNNPNTMRPSNPTPASNQAPPAGLAAKHNCHTCGQPIYTGIFQALGKFYHVNCFNCGNCGTTIGQKQFFNVEGDPNCQACYQNLFLTKCAHCDKPIQGSCIDALGKKWHAPCFVCTQCLSPFGTGLFYERDGMPFCQDCFQGMFSNRCGDCGQPVFGECINACGKAWHPDHFVCTTCRKAFGNQPYFEKEGKPYCQVHFYNQQGMTCACGCGRTIMGRAISAASKNWIPEHFNCGFCMNTLAGQKYTEKGDRCYCDFCYQKLFGK